MEGTEHHFGPFEEKEFGAIPGGPLFSGPFVFMPTFAPAPPPPKKPNTSPKTRDVMGVEGFRAERTTNSQAPTESAQPFLALELRAEKLRTSGFF